MNRKDLKTLMSHRDYPCVSIILPTHRTSADNKKDSIKLKNLVKEAVSRLLEEFGKREIQTLLDSISSLAGSIDHSATMDGLALFANRNYAAKFDLPFPVKEQVVIDETFATRSLVFALNRSTKYWTLVLSEKPTRLFQGFRDELIEVTGEDFPSYYDDGEPNAPRPTGDIVNESSYRDERQRQFFRKIDTALGKINRESNLPIVITGVERYLSLYKKESSVSGLIIAEVEGSYDRMTPHELSKLVWPLVYEHIERGKSDLLAQLDESIGSNRYAAGIPHVWRAAREGRGGLLLVEKDYHYPAVTADEGMAIHPAADPAAPGVIDDAVDEIIESVIEKGGSVAFVDNGALKEHLRIAMILRY